MEIRIFSILNTLKFLTLILSSLKTTRSEAILLVFCDITDIRSLGADRMTAKFDCLGQSDRALLLPAITSWGYGYY